MDTEDLNRIIEAIHGRSQRIVEEIEENTEKLQELLERVECIDNSMDLLVENSNAIDFDQVVKKLDILIQQGRP